MAEYPPFECTVITPEREVFSGQTVSLILPGADGRFGVLHGHTHYLSSLGVGEIKVEREGGTLWIACSGGFAEIDDNNVEVLAETAEFRDEIDIERARSAKERAEQRLREMDPDELDEHRARSALKRAETRLRVAKERE